MIVCPFCGGEARTGAVYSPPGRGIYGSRLEWYSEEDMQTKFPTPTACYTFSYHFDKTNFSVGYFCGNCQKIFAAFDVDEPVLPNSYEDDGEKITDEIAKKICPKCKAEIDFDYYRCPECGNENFHRK